MSSEVRLLTTFPLGTTPDSRRLSELIRTSFIITATLNSITILPPNVIFDFDRVLTAAENTELTNVVLTYTNVSLSFHKFLKMGLSDSECAKRIGAGYLYLGKRFSFSILAQLNLLGLKQNSARFVFPIPISTIDNMDSYQIASAVDADALFNLASDVKLSLLTDCNTVKANIRSALTIAAVDAASNSYLSGGAP